MNINDCNAYAITEEHFNCACCVWKHKRNPEPRFRWRSIRPVFNVEESTCTFLTRCCQTRWHWSRVTSGGKAGQPPADYSFPCLVSERGRVSLYWTRLICVNVLLSQLLFTEVRCFCSASFMLACISHTEKNTSLRQERELQLVT